MMTQDRFALWKFKTIEGLIYSNGYDFTTTKIEKGFEIYLISYDIATEIATIKNTSNPYFLPVEVSFKELPKTLKDMGLWIPRKENEIHSSAKVPL